MPHRDPVRDGAYLIILLAALVILSFLVLHIREQYADLERQWEEQHEEERDQTRRAADEIADRCGIAEGASGSVDDCLAAELDRYIAEDHGNQDLKAQQDMAHWARWLFWFTVPGTIISALGLVVLFVSLRQTRQAISDTRELGEAQTRAYVSFDETFDGMLLRHLFAGHTPEVSFRIKNTGASPARKVRIKSAVSIVPRDVPSTDGDLPYLAAEEPGPARVLSAGETLETVTLNQRPWSADDLASLRNPTLGRTLIFYGVATYEDVFRKDRQTRFCFRAEDIERDTTELFGFVTRASWVRTEYHNDET